MGKTKQEDIVGQNIGIYKVLYECDYKSKSGIKLFHVKCNECGCECDRTLKTIKESKRCVHTFIKPNENTELGIYKNIRPSGNVDKGNHALYYADCKICGETVERCLYDLRHFNTTCQHGGGFGHLNHITTIPSTKDYSKVDKDYYRRVYNLWRSMIKRTTESFWEKYPCYKGTTVSDDWLSFDKFYEDIETLPNYELWKESYGKRMMLDKDVLGDGKKHYSKETCCFLTHADSNRDVLSRHPEMLEKLFEGSKKYTDSTKRKVKATNKKTKEEIEFESIHDCARQLNLNFRHIWMCLSKDEKYKSHKSSKGWIFEEIE